MLARHMLKTGALLAAFAVLGTALVAMTFEGTKDTIAAQEREYLLRSLNALVPAASHDNDLYSDTLTVGDTNLFGDDPVTVYRARKEEQPVAVVLTPTAPDGYSGDIKLLVAITHDGTVLGVRVAAHRETPGLGDGIDIAKSAWITQFDAKSLTNPDSKRWRVKKDGGEFDQFTGATITPRAVVKAVRKSLEYFEQHRDGLFAPAAPDQKEAAPHG